MKLENFDYIYCLNPRCSNPKNSKGLLECHSCKWPLIFRGRLRDYFAVNPLDKGRRHGVIHDTSSYEGSDQQGRQSVLKVFQGNDARNIQLFEQEKEILKTLNHPNIPQLIDEFSWEVNGTKIQCLVSEKVEGCNLEDWLKKNNSLSQTEALKWMPQIVKVLDYVHKRNFLHQDIKPSNIIFNPTEDKLFLIDFSNVPDIVSPGYTPPEQADGFAIPSSDFFAMGRTFVHLLTGKHPLDLRNLQTGEIKWRQFAPKLSLEFVNLIDRLIEIDPQKRFGNASEILEEIESFKKRDNIASVIKYFNSKKMWILLVLAFLSGFVIGKMTSPKTNNQAPLNNTSCLFSNRKNSLRSLGEKTLLDRTETAKKNDLTYFRNFVNAIEKCDLDTASNQFESFPEADKRDPEIQIFQNNLKVAQSSKDKDYVHIIVPLPLNQPSDLDVLRGVAMAQEQFNQESSKYLLLVEIAKDEGNPDTVRSLAQEFVNEHDIHDIIAVVGHRTSGASLLAATIYQEGGLPMISPTATTTELSRFGDYIFRVVPSDQILSKNLVYFIKKQEPKIDQILICHDDGKYSQSFAKAVYNEFYPNSGVNFENVQPECNFEKSSYNEQKILNAIKTNNEQALILIPDTKPIYQTTAINLVKAIKNANLPIPLFGSDSMYNNKILEVGVEGMFFSVPWHPDNNPDFTKKARDKWGGTVSWRTAMAYDATQAIIQGLNNSTSPSRDNLKQALQDLEFSGATGQVKFLKNGDRQVSACIVKIEKIAKTSGDTPFKRVKCFN